MAGVVKMLGTTGRKLWQWRGFSVVASGAALKRDVYANSYQNIASVMS